MEKGTSAYKVAERREERTAQRESKGGNQRQGNVQMWKKGSLILFMEVDRPHRTGTVPNCPVLSVPTIKLLDKLVINSNFNNLTRQFHPI